MIDRYSSRLAPLGPMLGARLAGASTYDRIAGYFRSSLLEVVGEALETVGAIRVVCNAELDPHDVTVARAARDGQAALARTLVSAWQGTEDGIDLLLARERYRRLHSLLASGRMQVRVVPCDAGQVFVHGKAGVIGHADGRTYTFVGSANDSAAGFRHAYELLWGDADPAAAAWVRAEFEHFWTQGVNLPDAVIHHVGAMASRVEYRSIDAARDAAGAVTPAAVLAERPIYKGGQILRSWQKRFVQTCVDDRRLHGAARYLIADDVGLGKTLSMAAAALVLSVLDDKPVLILAPSTLLWQWQEELEDKLGIPAAVWSTQKKCWMDGERRPITQRNDPALVARCPWRIGIVSTGLIVNGDDAGERGALATKSFGVLILDEAHKARASRGQNGRGDPVPNQLLRFLRGAAAKATHVILGTATPIQLDAVELWDLLHALSQGAPHVLGRAGDGSEWVRDGCMAYLTQTRGWPAADTARWGLFRSPLPPAAEHSVFRDVRSESGLALGGVTGPRFDDLSPDIRTEFMQEFATLAERHNPVVRRVVRRTRPMLEERGLLKRIGVITHPNGGDGLPPHWLEGDGLAMSHAFRTAYEAAEAFSRLYAKRVPGAGFLKTILLRRIGSSAQAGLDTARHLLTQLDTPLLSEDELGDDELVPDETTPLDATEAQHLREVERCLAAVVAGDSVDPKVAVVLYYLRERGWLESNGAIVFSQYRTTAEWVLTALCTAFPAELIALYAGGAASFLQRGAERRTASREQIKRLIQNGDVRLLCATDAACEGLNLQRLGAQINIDMPWNPSRLEQRKGRVQRIGQVRDDIHVLSLRYSGTVEDTVYAALSRRLGNIFSVLGQLPDSFEADWIAAVLEGRSALQNFSQRVDVSRPPMEWRYVNDITDDDGLDWEYTEAVLSSRDLDVWMRKSW